MGDMAIQRVTKWVDSFTKYTILVSVIVVFELFVVTVVLLTTYKITFGMKPESWKLFLWNVYYIDCFINVLCIYLRCDFASKLYNILCGCCCCHCLCRKCGVQSMKHKKQKYKDSIISNTESSNHRYRATNTDDKEEETGTNQPSTHEQCRNSDSKSTMFEFEVTTKMSALYTHKGSETQQREIEVMQEIETQNANDANNEHGKCCL